MGEAAATPRGDSSSTLRSATTDERREQDDEQTRTLLAELTVLRAQCEAYKAQISDLKVLLDCALWIVCCVVCVGVCVSFCV